MGDKKNNEMILVGFSKGRLHIEVEVNTLHRDEAIDLARAEMIGEVANVDSWKFSYLKTRRA